MNGYDLRHNLFFRFLVEIGPQVGKNPGRYFDLCVIHIFSVSTEGDISVQWRFTFILNKFYLKRGERKKTSKLYLDTMFSEYNGHHVPPHYGGPHGPPPPHHHGGHMPPTGHHHPMAGPPQSYSPYMRPRMDPTSDVFTCLFGDLFVKWWVLAKSSFVWWCPFSFFFGWNCLFLFWQMIIFFISVKWRVLLNWNSFIFSQCLN